MCVYMYYYVCMCVCMLCTYVCMYVCMYVCVSATDTVKTNLNSSRIWSWPLCAKSVKLTTSELLGRERYELGLHVCEGKLFRDLLKCKRARWTSLGYYVRRNLVIHSGLALSSEQGNLEGIDGICKWVRWKRKGIHVKILVPWPLADVT